MAHFGASAAARMALAVAAMIVAVQCVLVTLFAWPALNTEPRDLPVVVAGPAQATAALSAALAQADPEAFDVTVVADEAAADAALRDREAYAAFVVSGGGVTLHLASAASPVVAQLLTQAAQRLGQGGAQGGAQGGQVRVVDVVPTDPDDPRGAGFAAGFLPLVMTSVAVGVVLSLLIGTRPARLLGVVTFAVLAGLAGTALLQYGLGAIPGSFLPNAGVVALVALAMAGAVAGLSAVAGRPGMGVAALTIFAIGNPLSAVGAAPELLPQPWGQVGQALPPGAGVTLLRSVAYFDGAGAGRPALVLAAWALVGLAAVAVGRRGNGVKRDAPVDAGVAEASPVIGGSTV